MAAVHNSAAERREQIENRIRDRIARADDAAERDRERNAIRTEKSILRERQRTRRELIQSLKGGYDGMVGFGNRAAMYSAAAAAGTGYAAKSALSTRMRMDTAETNMQIFGGLTKDQVEKMRSTWGDASAIKFGLSPDKMMDAFTEVAKAGIPDRIAKEVTESIMKASVGLEMDSVQTTKLAGGAATLLGDMKNLDPAKLTSIMTAIAIAARDSRADANEIVAANRRGSSVMSLGMTMEDLSAFTAGGISAGLQSSKTGTFMDYMVSELVNAKFKKGARGTALGAAATKLGMGGKAGLSAAAVANPTETLMTILDKMGEMSEQDRSKVAYQIGQREWSGELMQFVQVREKIRELLGAIKDPKNKNYLDEASEKKLKSLKGRWNSLIASWTLLWETMGAGLEKSFSEIVPWLTNWIAKLDKSKIRSAVEKAMEGIVKGLGFDSWTQMLEKTLGDPEKLKVNAELFFKVAKGFTEGMMNVFSAVGKVFTFLGKMFGVNTADPEAMARFVAEFIGFTIALRFIAPVIGTLFTIAEIIIKIGKALGAAKAAKGALGAIAGKIGEKGMDALKGGGKLLGGLAILDFLESTFGQGLTNSEEATKALIEELKKAREQKEKEKAGKLEKQSSIGEEVKQLGKNIEKVAFRGGLTDFSSVNRGGIMNASYTTSSGGGGGGLSGNVLSGAGTPQALLNSTPGQALPNFGVGSGGIIKRDSIPSFNGGGGSSAGSGAPFSAPGGTFGSKAPAVMQRLMDDFGFTKEQAAGVLGNLGHESGGFNIWQEKNPRAGRGGWGWAQWTGSRRRAFEAYCEQNGLDPKSDAANYGFLKQELMTTHKDAVNAVKGTSSAGDAMRAFEGTFEKAGVKNYGSRMDYTNQALAAFNNPGFTTGQQAANSFKGVPMRAGVDPRIQEIVNAGATHLPEGYSLKMTSGFRGHGAANHNGHAADYQIIGPDGKPISNRGEDPTGMYSLLARHSYGEMLARYPELKGKFAWGGAFGTQLGGGGQRDLMHFDTNGERGRYTQWQLRNMGAVPGTQYGITSGVPSAAEAVKNVPTAPAAGSLGAGQMRGGFGGPATININGNSHDPEALANLVQRRIDESMQWRMHDTESEYT
ncbi:hypothetical protein ACVJ6Q_003610 [Bradyrhizobium elkanii]